MKQYSDYFWKEGLPIGIGALSGPSSGISYKIPADPYLKHVSIEKYFDGAFVEIIYDSALFNFRHLTPVHQTSWQKTCVDEQQERASCHIRDQDDRLILIEEYRFEQGICRECRAYSPVRFLISIQKIYYKKFQDPFDGLLLLDSNQHPVMSKKYELDPETEQFAALIEEQWNMMP